VNSRGISFVAVAVALAGASCGGSSETASQPRTAEAARNGAVVLTPSGRAESAPYAPAGTAFDVRLEQPIDSRISTPGEAITATLVDPIYASNGDVLVPAGTRVYGRIANIDRVDEAQGPRIELDFDSVALRGGAVPIGARVLSAQQSRYEMIPAPSGVANRQAPGATEPQEQEGEATVQISMAKGSVLRLALTRPIVSAPQVEKK